MEGLSRRVLLSLQQVQFASPDGSTLGPLSWTLHARERVQWSCERETHWAALVHLLSGQGEVRGGRVHEPRPVSVQTDLHLWERTDWSQSIGAYLRDPALPRTIWLEGRLRSVRALADRLGIQPQHTRQPLKLEPGPVQRRFWALRWLLSGAELRIARELLREPDAHVREVLAQAWPELPCAVVAGVHAADLPGAVHTHVRLSAAGELTQEPGEGAAAAPPPE